MEAGPGSPLREQALLWVMAPLATVARRACPRLSALRPLALEWKTEMEQAAGVKELDWPSEALAAS
jgi:hypothetical protein